MDFTQENLIRFLLTYPVFLIAITIHEFAHAITARWGGDLTASYQGRVTLNPLAHIDPLGTVVMPLLMAFTSMPYLIGWAKPVQTVSSNYRRGHKYGAIVSLAGPFSNLLQAIFFTILLQALVLFVPQAGMGNATTVAVIYQICFYGVYLNIVLCIFNLLPLPPLDGFNVIWFLYVRSREALWGIFQTLSNNGFFILIILSAFGILGWIISFFSTPLLNLLLSIVSIPLHLRSS